MAIDVGEPAPSFTGVQVTAEGFDRFELAEEIGQGPIVLGFFPFAFSSTCHAQMCDLRDNLAELDAAGARAFGISHDSPFTLRAWREQNGFGFPLVSDHDREGTQAFGVTDDTIFGIDHPQRACFVIDTDGTVAWAWTTEDPEVNPDVEAIRQAVAKLG